MPPWFFYAIAAAVFAAFTAVLAKRGMEDLAPDFALGLRTAVVFGLLLIYLSLTGSWRARHDLTARSAGWLALSGMATALSWICYNRAVKFGPVSYVATIDKGSILLTLLLACVWLGEPFTWRTGFGAVLVCAGLIVLAWK
jgi:transporter family protein